MQKELSNQQILSLADKEKIELQNLLVVVDDIALPLEKIRLRAAGTHAGHNGLRSIQETLQTTEYAKLRFGVGNDFPKGRQSDFVLSRWLAAEEPLVKKKIDISVDAIETFATSGMQSAMSKINNVEIRL